MSGYVEHANGTPHTLPQGWRTVLLGEACEFLDSRRVPVNETERRKRIAGKSQEQLFPYYGANGQVGLIDGFLFDEPLILLAEDGGFFGSTRRAIAYPVSGRYWVNNHAHVLRPKPCVDFEFCSWALSIRPDVGRMVTGNTRPKLNQEVAAKIPLPLPPLSEQRRIASVLRDRMHHVQRSREGVLHQAKAVNALYVSLLRHIFDGSDASTWPTKRLGDLLVPRRDVLHPHTKPTGTATFVGLEHIEPVTGRRIGALTLDLSQLTGRKPRFAKGDIVYGYLRPYLNKVWIAEFDGLCSVDQFAYQVRGSDQDAEYVAWFMRSPTYLRRSAIDTTTGQLPRIGVEEIAAVEIPFPAERHRHAIVSYLRSQTATLHATRANLSDILTTIDLLPAALLREAFSGRL